MELWWKAFNKLVSAFVNYECPKQKHMKGGTEKSKDIKVFKQESMTNEEKEKAIDELLNLLLEKDKISTIHYGNALNNIALLYLSKRDSNSIENIKAANDYAVKAVEYFKQKKMLNHLAVANVTAGRTLLEISEFSCDNNDVITAISYFKQSIEFFHQHEMVYEYGLVCVQLSNAYRKNKEGVRKENYDFAIKYALMALRVFNENDLPENWGTAQLALANAIVVYPSSKPISNIEKGLQAANAAIEAFSKTSNTIYWAQAMAIRGDAYLDRHAGSKAENIENAIQDYKAALEILRPYSGYPIDYAKIQITLAESYLDRLLGVKSENIEQAIKCIEYALKYVNAEGPKFLWAFAQNILGDAYSQRRIGNAKENLELAITSYRQALKIRTQSTQPHDWSVTIGNLANAYADRIAGERAENQDYAIALFEEKLSWLTKDASPYEWAVAQTNLANIYIHRIYGDKRDNCEKALEYYTEALDVLRFEEHSHEFGIIQNNLANLYLERLSGERSQNIEKAISACREALRARTKESNPSGWAATQHTLGNAFHYRRREGVADNKCAAINYYKNALSIRTRTADPEGWATTIHNLGETYYQAAFELGQNTIDKAIQCYSDALEIRKIEEMPRSYFFTVWKLGQALMLKGEWEEAIKCLKEGQLAFQILLGDGLNQTNARDVIRAAKSVYSDTAYAYIQIGKLFSALEILEEGRAQLVRMRLRDNSDNLSKDQQLELRKLREQIAELELYVVQSFGSQREKNLVKIRQIRKRVQSIYSLIKQDDVSVQQRIKNISKNSVATCSFAFPLITEFGAALCIAYMKDGNLDINVTIDESLTLRRFREFMYGEGDFGDWEGWFPSYAVHQMTLNKRQKYWRIWMQTVDNLGEALNSLLLKLVQPAFSKGDVARSSRLFWMPSSALGLLPIGLFTFKGGGNFQRMCDQYEIIYTPSLRVIDLVSRYIGDKPRAEQRLSVIANPEGDLPSSEVEQRYIRSFFDENEVIALSGIDADQERVLEALQQSTYWHLAIHAEFDWTDARKSKLKLANNTSLTLEDLNKSTYDLKPELVILSACETGLYEIRHFPEEFVGFPSTFLSMGAKGVIASLWPVEDKATSLFFSKFYSLCIKSGLHPATALQQSQHWLANATELELNEFVSSSFLEKGAALEYRSDADITALRGIFGDLANEWASRIFSRNLNEKSVKPYSHPYFWGGFVYFGS